MRANTELKLHFVNVNHGDATIIEFPDYGSPPMAHFAAVDFGAKLADDRELPVAYMRELVDLRRDGDAGTPYAIDFVCVTHPHDDHFGGLTRFMAAFASATDRRDNHIAGFWDCGFRTNSVTYNRVLADVAANDNLTFVRVAAGAEFEFGAVRVIVLAPSVDLRNRFDTHGVGKNDASIVLRLQYRNSYAIIAGDAEFASWAKSTEEFPRRTRISFYSDALGLAERQDTSDQLKCDVLRVSHHGSKHGTSLEYLERLRPNRIVVSAGSTTWYRQRASDWEGDFPHPLTTAAVAQLDTHPQVYVTGEHGSLIFKYSGGWSPRHVAQVMETPGTTAFASALAAAWA